jgi:lipopolysaccharide/colanic/teichoic acid biosynthesis glycosyltransferase
MQPKRITLQRALNQQPEREIVRSTTKLTVVPGPVVDISQSLSNHSSAAKTFAAEEFETTDFRSMDFALPDYIDARVVQLTGARAAVPSISVDEASVYQLAKRGLDIVVAVGLLILVSPILLLLAVLVKMTSKGPVFFAHRRLGLDGKEFYCLKFRTMIADAEERLRNDPQLRRRFEEKFKLDDDPRITRLGAFLRRTSLDELPQLLHVFRGEMSLVGPRPIITDELGKYSIYAHKLLSVKPGLSGLWQVCGRSDTTYPQRVLMDMHYIDHRSFKLDCRLLLLTASAVIRKSGAC